MSKTIKDREYSFNHTKTRLKERYDIDISRRDYEYLCKKVEGKKDASFVMVEYQKNDTQYTYDLRFRYRTSIRVVWSENRNCITTVLLKEKAKLD